MKAITGPPIASNIIPTSLNFLNKSMLWLQNIVLVVKIVHPPNERGKSVTILINLIELFS